MGRDIKYTTIDRILSKLYRDLGLNEISETDIIEWTGEALEGIGVVSLLEEAVAFIEVKNHEAILPHGLHSIIQVARNNGEISDSCPLDIILENPSVNIEDTNTPVITDCKGNPLEPLEYTYYRPHFDLQYEYTDWQTSKYNTQFTPIRLANHSFFNSLVCEENSSLYTNVEDEYTIAGDVIRTSFKNGHIALAFNKQKIDIETGYPMIPDDYSVITAITMYITMKYMARLWYMGREGYGDKMQKAEADWQWYCKQASNNAMMIKGVDEHQNLYEERNNLIPRNNRYYGFFGRLGRAENKGFKDPNKRNFR